MVIGAAAIFVRVLGASGNFLLAIGAVLALALLIVVIVAFTRRRSNRQAEAFVRTGQLELEGSLAFDSLPGEWPTLARETLNPMGSDQVPALPVKLSISDNMLRLDKKQSWGAGRTPLRAEIPLAEITGVAVDKAYRTYAGSSIAFHAGRGRDIQLDVPMSAEQAEAFAGRFRRHLSGAPPLRGERQGLVVHADPPPVRTSATRAWVLMMICFVPFGIAMVGAVEGDFAAAGTFCLFTYGLWSMMRRKPTMHIRLAIGAAIVAVCFVADVLATHEPWRLIGALVSGAIAVGFGRLSTPGRTDN